MPKNTQPKEPIEIPAPERNPEINREDIPESPVLPEEEPEIIPEEAPLIIPPYEIPPPAEGP